MKKKERKEIGDLIDNLSKVNSEDDNFFNILDDIKDRIKEKQKREKRTGHFLAIAFLMLVISFFNLIIENNKIRDENYLLEKDILNKRNLIQDLKWTDSLAYRLLDIKNDSIQIISYRSENGIALTYSDLANRNDSLYNVNNRLEHSLLNKDREIEILNNRLLLIKNDFNIYFYKDSLGVTYFRYPNKFKDSLATPH